MIAGSPTLSSVLPGRGSCSLFHVHDLAFQEDGKGKDLATALEGAIWFYRIWPG